MAFGLGVLRLEPRAFWAMSPRELSFAIDGHYGRASGRGATTRSALDLLMAAFPDKEKS